jgi:hypothetical protein
MGMHLSALSLWSAIHLDAAVLFDFMRPRYPTHSIAAFVTRCDPVRLHESANAWRPATEAANATDA